MYIVCVSFHNCLRTVFSFYKSRNEYSIRVSFVYEI